MDNSVVDNQTTVDTSANVIRCVHLVSTKYQLCSSASLFKQGLGARRVY